MDVNACVNGKTKARMKVGKRQIRIMKETSSGTVWAQKMMVMFRLAGPGTVVGSDFTTEPVGAFASPQRVGDVIVIGT